jgi:hypothetical protein
MSLETTLADITARLRQGRFPNEQAIFVGIVLRVLPDLGWDPFDAASVWPEFQTGEGRADCALCHPPTKPVILIEVKQPGKAEDAVRQALGYAFHTGVPFIVLSDGQTWSFYLPAEAGSYEDRRVYKLDLFERQPAEAATILEKYLSRARVASGEALRTAIEEYRNRARRVQAKAAIPDAWHELIETGDEILVELVADAVESKTGVRPEDDDVAEFLLQLGRPVAVPHGETARPVRPPAPTPEYGRDYAAPAPQRHGMLTFRGREFHYGNAKEAMAIILRELARSDPNFLERFAQHPDAQGRSRRYIARTAEDLYPNRPDLHVYNEPLPGGWVMATNLNNVQKMAIIRLAAKIAGLRFGEDLVVSL